MGLLCINRTLQRGLLAGLCVGAGIATGDAAYGAVAAFGFTAITDFLVSYALVVRLVGGGSDLDGCAILAHGRTASHRPRCIGRARPGA